MKLYCFLFLLGVCVTAHAQEPGIHFEHALSWKEIQEKAKTENKYIFIDCFTTWCGPCKKMSNELFPLKEMGDYFNSRFINVKVQMDVTPKDDAFVRAWYKDAQSIQERYGVIAFPTFLYFSPDGKLAYRAVGSKAKAEEFIEVSSNAFDSSKQYLSAYQQELKEANGEEVKLRQLFDRAAKEYDDIKKQQLARMLMDAWGDDKERKIAFADSALMRSSDYGFTYLLENMAAVDAIKGQGYTQKRLSTLLVNEVVHKIMTSTPASTDSTAEPDWKGIHHQLAAKYPALDKSIQVQIDLESLRTKFILHENFPGMQEKVFTTVQSHLQVMSHEEKMHFGSWVFNNCADTQQLKAVIGWIEIDKNKDARTKNLYANILYKCGDSDKAILLMDEVIALSDKGKPYYRSIQDKMKQHQPTWSH